MTLNEMKLDYARLIISQGLNLQKGQRMLISSPVECAEFARMCASEAYKSGCREVVMNWYDDYMTREKFLHADSDIFDTADPCKAMLYNTLSDEGAAFLSIYSEDPEYLLGVSEDRIRRSQMASGKALETFRTHETRNDMPWCVVSVPTEAWAKKVFPNLNGEKAQEKLWHAILDSVRVDGGDSAENWKKHSDELQARVRIMNDFNFKYLHYTNSLGTDLTVELPEGHYWAGGNEISTKGIEFSANIPTEEIFTLPKRDGVNGVVYGTKPLVLSGNIVTGFRFVVKNGRIVEIHADKNEEILKAAVSVDEGASYFGEVALVPHDSPISNSGILFYNMLFDENAACHIAFGEAYPCIKGSENMSEDELKSRGVNYSITHEDFMVGSPDLSIIGTTHDGKEIPVFVNGNFAF